MIPNYTRIQHYLRQNALNHYEMVSIPPFSLFFHRSDPLTYFNYAIPDEPCSGDLHEPLRRLQKEFTARNRQPRFEFIEEFAPDLPAVLQAEQFQEEARQQGMICTLDSYRPAPEAATLTIMPLSRVAAALDEARIFVSIQQRGFNPEHDGMVTDQDARQFLDDLHEGEAFIARLDGEPVGVGMYTSPLDGLAEIVGIATLTAFRRKGIGTAITSAALRSAFHRELEAMYLTAEDARAGRVYERVGFRPCATMLAYSIS